MAQAKIGTSKTHWFLRGLMLGVILLAGANAASYLFRSNSIEHLFEGGLTSGGAIGFPLEIWRHDLDYGAGRLNYFALGINWLIAVGIGATVGIIAVVFREKLNRGVEDFEAQAELKMTQNSGNQFSVSSMLWATALVAVLFAFVTQWSGSREVLWFVYVMGPVVLIGIAFLPPNLGWQARCVVLLMAAVVVIGGAIWSGSMRGLEFDRTLMGIFIFWTPQSAFGVFGLLLLMVWQQLNAEPIEEPGVQ